MAVSHNSSKARRAKQSLITESPESRALTRLNFILMAVCGILIVIGFMLMGGGATTQGEFNADIFSTRRIIIGPAIAFIGFVAMAFAIMYRNPKDSKEEN